MKKIILLSAYLLIAFAGFSQPNTKPDSIPSYIRNNTIPAFVTYKAPDSTRFTEENIHKGKPVLLMIFSPDCGHCQHVTEEILKDIRHFKNDRIVMITWLPFSDMMSFYKNYKIANYPQITMAWDPKFFFLPYYHVQSYPKLIVYNKKGKFVKEFQGNLQLEDVWQTIDQK